MDRSSYLRKALLGNAAFSTLCGLDMLVAPEMVVRFIGLADPRQLRDRMVGTAALLIARPDLLNTAGIRTAIVVADIVAASSARPRGCYARGAKAIPSSCGPPSW